MSARSKVLYSLVGTRGGVVLGELGSRPVYLEAFLQKIQPSSTVKTVKVRNDYIAYSFGPCNIYLAMYREIEAEQEVEGEVEAAKEKIENTPGAKELHGVFKALGECASESENAEEEEAAEPDSDPEEEPANWSRWKKAGSIMKLFSRREDITEKSVHDHLIGRNVPNTLSRKISRDIMAVLKNECADSPQTAESVRSSFRKVISEIVPTMSPESIISEIEAHRKSAKTPYVFCMVGVNGVGKSTTLSKLCLWILKNKYKICVAACDGFRSGAIEQLKKYVDRYQARGHAISLYEKGYKKDEASIASKAISHALEHHFDVVLIDTCGRMPGNTQSMMSLTKLIRVNKPNKIFYVGEALVGNDSIQQIQGFNEYIERACVNKSVDGIIVTKCDTVDDKIGTIVSLAHTVDKPIAFIGVGQKNVDLLPFDIDSLCESLYI
ncbi:signal recognition particle receptor subunit alpha [Nematocida major]|uniref:signal recognition particle receptor subunit alpha n=1 Tax=Nematocida major TaxID=1912982 RepID=UPI00200875B5|nr:signal recognition particle receptor subunit alpha [Nematocida major]KAH9387039.1 signal recognition particle receptor subunit alpha [Nematocida major]